MVSTFGKMADSGDYVFFAADSANHELRAAEERCRLPVLRLRSSLCTTTRSARRTSCARARGMGRRAQHRQRRQVQPGLGVHRHLHPRPVRGDQPRRQPPSLRHVCHRFPARQAAVHRRLCAPGGDEAVRAAGSGLHARGFAEDRRYLLYNPIVKMKVTTQGEEVINLLWDVIAAKGFEKDMYFEMPPRATSARCRSSKAQSTSTSR